MDELGRIVDWSGVQQFLGSAEHWLLTEVLVRATLFQVFAVALAAGFAYLATRPIERRLEQALAQVWSSLGVVRRLIAAVPAASFPIGALITLLAAREGFVVAGQPVLLLTTAINLFAVWVVIHFSSRLIRHENISRFIAAAAFVLATLNILELLQPAVDALAGSNIGLGSLQLNLLALVTGLIQFAVLLWLALAVARIAEQRIMAFKDLTPSVQVLSAKLLRLLLVAVAFLIAMRTVGIDLTALAVLAGAFGVGAGFGLQKLVSNLVSGLILLLDRSIRPGDVIEVGDSFGWVSSLNARYATVTTRDGKSWLIPNEDLITQRVVNWTFNDNRLRLIIPFGVSYECDIRLAMRLAIEAAEATARVLKEPAPVCRLVAFGDSAVQMELRLWIQDPVNGIVNVRSAVLLNVWDRFQANRIEIPMTQQDVRIKPGSELDLTVHRPPRPAA